MSRRHDESQRLRLLSVNTPVSRSGTNSHDHMCCRYMQLGLRRWCWQRSEPSSTPRLKLVYCVVAQVPAVGSVCCRFFPFCVVNFADFETDTKPIFYCVASADYLNDVWHLEVGRIVGALLYADRHADRRTGRHDWKHSCFITR